MYTNPDDRMLITVEKFYTGKSLLDTCMQPYNWPYQIYHISCIYRILPVYYDYKASYSSYMSSTYLLYEAI